jgi:hypothetical protein
MLTPPERLVAATGVVTKMPVDNGETDGSLRTLLYPAELEADGVAIDPDEYAGELGALYGSLKIVPDVESESNSGVEPVGL